MNGRGREDDLRVPLPDPLTEFSLAGLRVFVAGHRGLVGGAIDRLLRERNYCKTQAAPRSGVTILSCLGSSRINPKTATQPIGEGALLSGAAGADQSVVRRRQEGGT